MASEATTRDPLHPQDDQMYAAAAEYELVAGEKLSDAQRVSFAAGWHAGANIQRQRIANARLPIPGAILLLSVLGLVIYAVARLIWHATGCM
jgi:hypothetical protein